MESFLLPPNGVSSPETIANRRRMAESLMNGGIDSSPVGSPWQAAARVAQAALGGWGIHKADQMEQKGRKGADEQLAKALMGDNAVSPSQQDPNGALVAALSNPFQSQAGLSMAGQKWQDTHPTAEQQYARDRQMKADAWANTQRQTEMEKQQQEQDALKARTGMVDKMLHPDIVGMGPMQSQYSPQQQQQAQFALAGNDPNAAFNALQPPKEEAPPLPAGVQEYNFYAKQLRDGGQQPLTFDDWKLRNIKAGSSQTIVAPGERAYAIDRGKDFAKRAGEFDAAEQSAVKVLNNIGSMKTAMADPSFYSGSGAENVVLPLKKFIVSIGGDPTGVSSMETFAVTAKQLALDSMGGSLGTGFSNADRDFITGQVPSLENTPTGNTKLMDITEKLQRRKIEITRMAREYEVAHGQIDPIFMQNLSTWAEQNPLFPNGQKQDGNPVLPSQDGTVLPGQVLNYDENGELIQ